MTVEIQLLEFSLIQFNGIPVHYYIVVNPI